MCFNAAEAGGDVLGWPGRNGTGNVCGPTAILLSWADFSQTGKLILIEPYLSHTMSLGRSHGQVLW